MNRFAEAVFLIVLNITMTANVVLILELLFGMRIRGSDETERRKRTVKAFFFVTLMNVLITALGVNEIVQMGAVLLTMVVTAIYLSGGKFRYGLATISAVLIDTQISTIAEAIDEFLIPEKYYFSLAGKQQTPFYVFSDFLLLAVLALLLHLSVKRGVRIRLSVGEAIGITGFCVFLPVMVMVMETIIEENGRFSVGLGWIVFLIVVDVAIFYGVIHRNMAKKYKERAKEAAKQFDHAVNGIRLTETRRDRDIRIGHDMKNHFLVVDKLLEAGNHEEAENYIKKLRDLGYSTGPAPTGNKITDILLSVKYPIMQEADIAFSCTGNLELLNKMDDVDVSILMSNLLDNAIEACRRFDGKRYIKIQTAQLGDRAMLVIKNPTDHAPERRGRGFASSKDAELQREGIGLINVKETEEKYHADCEFKEENGEFVARITFK